MGLISRTRERFISRRSRDDDKKTTALLSHAPVKEDGDHSTFLSSFFLSFCDDDDFDDDFDAFRMPISKSGFHSQTNV